MKNTTDTDPEFYWGISEDDTDVETGFETEEEAQERVYVMQNSEGYGELVVYPYEREDEAEADPRDAYDRARDRDIDERASY